MFISKCRPLQHTSNSSLMKIFSSLFVFALSLSLPLPFCPLRNGRREREENDDKSDWLLFARVPLHERETRARDRCLFYTVGSLFLPLYVCMCAFLASVQKASATNAQLGDILTTGVLYMTCVNCLCRVFSSLSLSLSR